MAVAQGQFTIFEQEDGLNFKTFTSVGVDAEGNRQIPQHFTQDQLNGLSGTTGQTEWTGVEELGNLKINDSVLIICYNVDKEGEVCVFGTVSEITDRTNHKFKVGSMSLLDKGDKGEQGIQGPDGIYVKTIIEQYFLSTDVNSPTGPSGSVNGFLVCQWVDIGDNAKIPIVKIKNSDGSITTYYRFRRQKYIWSDHNEEAGENADDYHITYSVARLDETDQRIVDWCSANDSTFIDGGHIYANSISADKLNVNNLSSINANLGDIKTGRIRSEDYEGELIKTNFYQDIELTFDDISDDYYENDELHVLVFKKDILINSTQEVANVELISIPRYVAANGRTYYFEEIIPLQYLQLENTIQIIIGLGGTEELESAREIEVSIQMTGTQVIGEKYVSGAIISFDNNNPYIQFPHFSVNASGDLVAQNADIRGGKIGGWFINEDSLTNYGGTKDSDGYYPNSFCMQVKTETNGAVNALAIGKCSKETWSQAAFRVTTDGELYASNGAIGSCEFQSTKYPVVGKDLENISGCRFGTDRKLRYSLKFSHYDNYSQRTFEPYSYGNQNIIYDGDTFVWQYAWTNSYNTQPSEGDWKSSAFFNNVVGDNIENTPYLWFRCYVTRNYGNTDIDTVIYYIGDFSGYLTVFDFHKGIMGIGGNIITGKTASIKFENNCGRLSGTWYYGDAEIATTVTTSWRGAKSNIEKLDNRYSILFDELQPVRFTYNNGKSNRYHTGFILDELKTAMDKANVNPSELAAYCVSNEDTGEGGIRYGEFIALCINEIQKLKKRVEELENNTK